MPEITQNYTDKMSKSHYLCPADLAVGSYNALRFPISWPGLG